MIIKTAIGFIYLFIFIQSTPVQVRTFLIAWI